MQLLGAPSRRRSTPVTLRVKDEDGRPTTAAFEIRDTAGRVYPLPSKRLEPDFFFHPQVYRADGETVRLPAGRYSVVMSRGPESVAKTVRISSKGVAFSLNPSCSWE